MKPKRLFRILMTGMLALGVSACQESSSKLGTPPPSDEKSTTARPKLLLEPEREATPIPVTRAQIGPNVVLEVPQELPIALGVATGLSFRQSVLLGGFGAIAAPVPSKVIYWPVRADARRRVLVHASVCLQEGYLEHLLSRTQSSKQHESVFTSELDARHIHAALLLAGAKPGKPVQFRDEQGKPVYRPPSGNTIKIIVEYEQDGKLISMRGQRFIVSARTGKELKADWVFAGSVFYPPPEAGAEPLYGANDGRVICTTNFGHALLDLPFRSEDADPQQGLEFKVNKQLVPPLETRVTLVLEPVDSTKK